MAGGLNLYGFAGGDPVNLNDPLGLRVCFGFGRRVEEAVEGTEESTGTEITLDEDNCIESIKNVGGKAFEELQEILQLLIDSSDYFHVRLVDEGGSNFQEIKSTNRDSRAFVAEISDFNLRPEYKFSSCTTRRWERFDAAQLVAHELIGHGSGIVQPTAVQRIFRLRPKSASQGKAINYENISNRARGRPLRC